MQTYALRIEFKDSIELEYASYVISDKSTSEKSSIVKSRVSLRNIVFQVEVYLAWKDFLIKNKYKTRKKNQKNFRVKFLRTWISEFLNVNFNVLTQIFQVFLCCFATLNDKDTATSFICESNFECFYLNYFCFYDKMSIGNLTQNVKLSCFIHFFLIKSGFEEFGFANL